MKISYFIFVR